MKKHSPISNEWVIIYIHTHTHIYIYMCVSQFSKLNKTCITRTWVWFIIFMFIGEFHFLIYCWEFCVYVHDEYWTTTLYDSITFLSLSYSFFLLHYNKCLVKLVEKYRIFLKASVTKVYVLEGFNYKFSLFNGLSNLG